MYTRIYTGDGPALQYHATARPELVPPDSVVLFMGKCPP